jgi:osmotically-inducible protein OsmY
MARIARLQDDMPQHRPVPRPSDRDVKSTVVRRLRENPYTQGSRIKVQVRAGVVTLAGAVDSPVAKDVARGDAEVVPGVVEVADGLVVQAAA